MAASTHGIAAAGPRRIAIAAGGTAGHVYPALSVAETYEHMFPGTEVFFLGTQRGYEAELVPALGRRFTALPGLPFLGRSRRAQVAALATAVRASLQARRLLQQHAIDLVIGFGGYVSAGPVLAAALLGRPVVLHEANCRPGLANRLLGRLANATFIAFAEAAESFPAGRTQRTGTPVRGEIAAVAERRAVAPATAEARILVLGGSLGSAFINQQLPSLAAALQQPGRRLSLWHQTGLGDATTVRTAYVRAGVEARVDSFIDDMAAAYEWATLAISCAGAVTLAELACAAVPAILVPLAMASEDHQYANAAAIARETGCIVCRESDWSLDTLVPRIESWLTDRATLADISRRLRQIAPLDAAEGIVRACELLLATGQVNPSDR